MTLASVKHVYTQEVDCCADGLDNTLTIETHDGGGGWYVVIRTERWALNPEDIDIFVTTLKAVLAQEPK